MTVADRVNKEMAAIGAKIVSGRDASLVAKRKNKATKKIYVDAARPLRRGFLVITKLLGRIFASQFFIYHKAGYNITNQTFGIIIFGLSFNSPMEL